MKIFKGCHYEFPLKFKLYFGKCTLFKRGKFTFTDSCRYSIGEDQNDINKFFGFSYGFHHKNSDRIGWRYDPSKDRIELFHYYYKNGMRSRTLITDVAINEPVVMQMTVHPVEKSRCVSINIGAAYHTVHIDSPIPRWGYTLGFYFGGNRVAPHTIIVDEL